MVHSRLEGFYKKSLQERLQVVARQTGLSEEEEEVLLGKKNEDALKIADLMSENVIGLMQLPLSIATNFKVNGKEVLVPIAIEESSVVAASSNAAKLCLPKGFTAKAGEQIMIGQIQVMNVKDVKEAFRNFNKQKENLMQKATDTDQVLKNLGGGCKDIIERVIYSKRGKMLVFHLLVDVKDAMGANAVNSMCETLKNDIEKITEGEVRLRIISNYALHRVVEAEAIWTKKELGAKTIEGILDAYHFAYSDKFRAVTHNKGIMNGIDSVVIATGNDFRAVEAGAHSYAAITGHYEPLTHYEKDKKGNLAGSIRLPLALGIIGGATKVNPVSMIAVKIMGVKSAKNLSEIVASVGLAQNFAALNALATKGIQEGHMKLHARNIAVQAGAKGWQAEEIARKMIKEKKISQARAEELLKKLKKKK